MDYKINIKKFKNGQYKIFDKIFLINLKKRKDRKLFCKLKLRDLDHDIYLFKAIDGSKSTYQKIYHEYIDKPNGGKFKYGGINSSGALGLLLTWRNMLKYSIDNNLKNLLVLEDDVYLHKNFMNKLITLHDNKSFDEY